MVPKLKYYSPTHSIYRPISSSFHFIFIDRNLKETDIKIHRTRARVHDEQQRLVNGANVEFFCMHQNLTWIDCSHALIISWEGFQTQISLTHQLYAIKPKILNIH